MTTWLNPRSPHTHVLASLLAPALVALVTIASQAKAEVADSDPVSDDKPLPLPLHQIEGNGGIFITQSAYLVNPPRNGELVGRPSLGFSYANLGNEQNLEALTITESPFKRLELGFGWDHFGLGTLPLALRSAGFANYSQDHVELYNFNARVQILKEGEFDQKWIPAVTFGAHYKHNEGISDVNNQVFGLLASHGLTSSYDVDYTLYASKMFMQLPLPLLLEVGGRATKGIWEGFAGFTDHYQYVAEGNIVGFLSHKVAIAAEYKEQPKNYQPIGTLVQRAGDWWTVDALYIVDKHMTIASGYGHFGAVLNEKDNGVWGITFKWEF